MSFRSISSIGSISTRRTIQNPRSQNHTLLKTKPTLSAKRTFSQTPRLFDTSKATYSPPVDSFSNSFPKKVEGETSTKKGQNLKSIFKSITVDDMLKKKGTNEVIFVEEDSKTYEAVKLMSEKAIGAVVVTSNGKPKGIFTERDYMGKLILKGKSSKKTPIKEVTAYGLETVTKKTTLDQCGEIMIRKIIRHLPILEDGKIVGMISVRDVAEHMVNAGHSSVDLKLAQSPDTVEDVFNRLGRISSEQCFVDPSDSVLHALQLMDKHRIGAVFVVDGQKLVGIFTERDYLHKVVVQEKASKTTIVGDVMTKDVIVVDPTEQIGKCLNLMVKGKFRNLPVVPLVGDRELDSGEYRSVLGIITLVDVIRFLWNLGKK